jgi:hypothetical protein
MQMIERAPHRKNQTTKLNKKRSNLTARETVDLIDGIPSRVVAEKMLLIF